MSHMTSFKDVRGGARWLARDRSGARVTGDGADLGQFSAVQLLKLHAKIAEALRARGITRTSNNPTGDLAEYLFCKAFGWKQADNSKANIDAIDAVGRAYKIKGRRVTRHNNSRQLSAIRDLVGGHFDFLAGVIVSEDFSVLRAAIIPPDVVRTRAKFVERTNSHKFLLREDVWDASGVRDVTDQLRAASRSMAALADD